MLKRLEPGRKIRFKKACHLTPNSTGSRSDDDRRHVLYQSKLTQYTDLPLLDKQRPYMVEKIIPREHINLDQDSKNEVAFRITTINENLNGQPCMVQIGKPVEKLEEEIIDLIQGIAAGLIVVTLLLIVLSYFIAGKDSSRSK